MYNYNWYTLILNNCRQYTCIFRHPFFSPIEREFTIGSDFHFKLSGTVHMHINIPTLFHVFFLLFYSFTNDDSDTSILPLMIGDKIDKEDEHWECFLLLWDI